jgi:hypothetical protein
MSRASGGYSGDGGQAFHLKASGAQYVSIGAQYEKRARPELCRLVRDMAQ